MAFSNAIGGYLFYGIIDDIKNESEKLEECVTGLSGDRPFKEDIGGWIRENVKPSTYCSPVRRDNVTRHNILKCLTKINVKTRIIHPDSKIYAQVEFMLRYKRKTNTESYRGL